MNPNDPQTATDTVTHLTALGAVVSPLWLHTLSDVATTALPLLGCAWLILQAFLALYKTFWKNKPDV